MDKVPSESSYSLDNEIISHRFIFILKAYYLYMVLFRYD